MWDPDEDRHAQLAALEYGDSSLPSGAVRPGGEPTPFGDDAASYDGRASEEAAQVSEEDTLTGEEDIPVGEEEMLNGLLANLLSEWDEPASADSGERPVPLGAGDEPQPFLEPVTASGQADAGPLFLEPAQQEPANREPAFLAPAYEELAYEELAHEEPVNQAPANQEPVFLAPAYEELAHGEPVNRESANQVPALLEPGYEELAHEELAGQEPANREPTFLELVHQQLAHEEPADQEPANQEPTFLELVHQQLAHEEPVSQEPANQVPAFLAPAYEELAHEEPANQEPANRQPTFLELVQQQLAHEEPADQEPANQEPVFLAPAYEEPAYEELAHEELAHEEPADQKPANQEPVFLAAAHQQLAHEEPTNQKPTFLEPALRQPVAPSTRRESVLRLLAAMYPEVASRILPDGDASVLPRRGPRAVASGFVAFRLGGEGFAIPLQNVLEADRLPDPTPVPFAGEFVRGVTNRRGEIIPLIDLRLLFGLDPAPNGGQGRMLVIRSLTSGPATAIVVDSLGGIAWPDSIGGPGASGPVSTKFSGLLSGCALHRDATVHILDVDRLLERIELEERAV